jgi:hypothetical protein
VEKLSISPTPHPHLALKIAVGVGLTQGLMCLESIAFALWAISSYCVWLKVLGGDVLLNDHFLMTIWGTSGLDFPDTDINNLCYSVFFSFLKSAVSPTTFASRGMFFQLKAEDCVYPGFQRVDSQSLHPISKVLFEEYGI